MEFHFLSSTAPEMLDENPGTVAVSRASAGNPRELPDLLGSLLPITPTAMALLAASPQDRQK